MADGKTNACGNNNNTFIKTSSNNLLANIECFDFKVINCTSTTRNLITFSGLLNNQIGIDFRQFI